MASRTQLRLGQVTGSFGDAEGKIVDNLAVAATLAAIPAGSGSMVSALSQFASAIKRINGGTAFTTNAAGVFTHATVKLGSGGNELEIQESSDNITLDVTTADKDLIFVHNTSNTGDNTEIMRIDGSAESLLMAGTKKIEFNDDGTFIHSDADGKLKLSADGTASDAINIDSAGGFDVDAADEISLTTTSADGHISLVSAHTAGVALHIDANANAASEVQIDAGILDIDVTGVASIDSGGTLSLGTANSGVAISIGHTTSEVTVNDNLTVTGDLTVNGATTTLDTTNLLVEDVVIGMAANAGSANQNGGLAIFSGSSNSDLVFGRVANDMWGTGKKATLKGTVTTLADMTLVDLATKGISINGTSFDHALALNGSNLKLGSTGDIEIDPDSGNVLFGDGSATIVDINVADAKLTIHDDAQVANKFEIAVGDNGETTLTSTDTDAAIAHISVVADGNITLDSAGDIVLDADGQDITLKDGGTEYGNIRLNVNADGADTGDLIVSASLGTLGLDGAGGMVVLLQAGSQFLYFEKDSDNAKLFPAGNGANDIIFEDGALSSNEVFRVDGALQALAMPQQNATGNGANVGILSFNGNNDVNEAIYGDGSALYLRSNAVNFKLPTADGNADQVLKTDGSGNLSFTDIAGNVSRRQMSIIAALSSGSALNPNSVTVSNTAPYSRAALDLSGVSASNLDNLIDVYVNGQLLISGSDAHVGAGSADYFVSTHTNASQFKFGFDLEIDDTVIVNTKG